MPDPLPTGCPLCGGGPLRPWIRRGADRLHATPGRFPVLRCGACRGGVTRPEVTAAELAALYPESYAPYDERLSGLARLASRAIRARQARRALRSGPLRAARDLAPGRALDVGCGRGDLGATLIARGWQVTGVEPSPAACAHAAARGLDARAGTLVDVALEDGAYDLAVFHHSLEHTLDPVADLRRVHSALRPGGRVLVSVPHAGSWQARTFRGRWYHLDLPRHRFHFTRAALSAALQRAGFEPPTELSTSTSALGLPASIQYVLAGRCLFPGGMRLRVVGGLASGCYPLARALDRLAGDGDVLEAIARRAASTTRSAGPG